MAAKRKAKGSSKPKTTLRAVKPKKAKSADVRGGTSLFAQLHVYDTQAKLANDELRAAASGSPDAVGKPISRLY